MNDSPRDKRLWDEFFWLWIHTNDRLSQDELTRQHELYMALKEASPGKFLRTWTAGNEARWAVDAGDVG